MMKYILTLVIGFICLNSNAQFDDIKKKDSCYFKLDANGKRITKPNRYAEWECGKLAGVIDCNQELSFDEATNIVSKKATDNVNLQGVGKPFTGRCEMCHMNGTLQRRVTFVNGKENGVDTSYYESGCPQVIRSHVQGVENGTWYYYYDSTNYLAWEMNYSIGEKHGKHIFFASNGDTTQWENYQNGILDGIKRTYYEDSKIKREVSYKLGIFDGPFKIYNREGIVIEEITYKQGQKNETAKYFYDDGTLLKTESWDMGVKNGEFKIFFYQGNVQVSESYKKGIKEGWFKEFYPDGSTKNSKLYKKDELLEEHRYDEHGRETYSFGTPTGDSAEDDAMPSTKKKKGLCKKKKKD